MRKALAIAVLSAAAIAAPLAAQAVTTVSVAVEAPSFGIRVGGPHGYYGPYASAPVYAPPVYLPAPVYAPPVVYVSPRVVVPGPVVYPAYPYGYGVGYKHWKHPHRHVVRPVVPVGYPAYGRY